MRCNLYELRINFNGQTQSQNILISENVVNSFVPGSGFTSATFEKNIFHSNDFRYSSSPAIFKNNIFYTASSAFAQYSWQAIFDNCIIIQTASNVSNMQIGCESSIFNNLLVSYTTGNPAITYYGTVNNPLTNEPTDSTFINANTTSFSYTNNYHLKLPATATMREVMVPMSEFTERRNHTKNLQYHSILILVQEYWKYNKPYRHSERGCQSCCTRQIRREL